ncbi:MAG: hypothetical protein C4530_09710 [Desulfobacteraceae bacterium]|jgi:hypothetical protein|nr:MAG: hypothetical protein C4530_09710 [Desulfobacteraceae bacterium]
MKKVLLGKRVLDLHLGCLGEFSPKDPVCKLRCALRLRCVIEQDQNERTEILEELVSFDGVPMKLQ